jgi:ComF family protein
LAKSAIKEILLDFVALFYPRYCLACEGALVKGEDIVCTGCMRDMPTTDYHLDQNNSFFRKLQGRITVKYVLALFRFTKESRVQNLLHALKYKNHPEVGVMLGKRYGSELLATGYKDHFDIIIPVPLHATRLRTRGYNQSMEFGRGLSEVLEIPCLDGLLIRTSKTGTQTRKTRLKRWQNVKEVFKVAKAEEIQGKRILIVDDVITTGATLEACISVLNDNHCGEISIACIAAAQ